MMIIEVKEIDYLYLVEVKWIMLNMLFSLLKLCVWIDWQVGTGEGDGVRALIAFYPADDASSSNGMKRQSFF